MRKLFIYEEKQYFFLIFASPTQIDVASQELIGMPIIDGFVYYSLISNGILNSVDASVEGVHCRRMKN